MNDSLTNCKMRVLCEAKRLAANFRPLVFVVAFFCFLTGNTLAQNLTDEQIREEAARIQKGNEEARRNALHRLRASESENASRIATEGLTDKSEIVRATAPFSVLSLSSDEAAENLLPQLKDKSEYVRRETAYALGKTRSNRATQPLLDILQKDKIYSVRSAAAVALGEIGDIAAVGALTRILERSPIEAEEFLRRAAARSIGQIAEMTLAKEFLAQIEIKDFDRFVLENRKTLSERFPLFRSSVAVLIKTLQNQNEADDVKREAAFALGAIGDLRAAPVLQAKLDAEDYYLAEISRHALRKILTSQ